MAKVAWYVASLEQKGGGERFVLEAARALRLEGHTITIICDRFAPGNTFSDLVEQTRIVPLEASEHFHQGYLRRLSGKAFAIARLYRALRQIDADLVFCQSEFDAIRLAIVAVFLRFPLRVFVFGQMYQFASDNTKYARVFRRHLRRIRDSRPGYAQTVFDPPPRLSLVVSLANEVVSVLKLWALRRAERIFTLSAQVQWEVSLSLIHI